ncbi:ion channel [Streptomyces sp. NPDC047990]|uniref:ion channel n=1 Tax=Streptomyces sp. NPDC047990 TaxID=3365496 RepID=UPI0037228E25
MVDLALIFLLGIYFLWAVVKSITMIRSIYWAAQHGGKYTEDFKSDPPETELQRYALLEENSAGFFPFGAKSYKIRVLFLENFEDGAWRRRTRRLGKILLANFWQSGRFMLLVGITVEGVNTFGFDGSPRIAYLVVIMALWSVLYNIMLVVEALAWFVMVRSYAFAYFMLGSIKSDGGWRESSVSELLVLGTLLAFSIFNLTVAVSSIKLWMGGFKSISRGSGFSGEVRRFVQSLYYVLANMTTVGDGDISPTTSMARFSIMLGYASQLLIITFSVALLLSAVSRDEPAS